MGSFILEGERRFWISGTSGDCGLGSMSTSSWVGIWVPSSTSIELTWQPCENKFGSGFGELGVGVGLGLDLWLGLLFEGAVGLVPELYSVRA